MRRNVVDEVANYLPLRSFYEHSSRIAALCKQHGIFMRFDPEIFDLKIARARTEELDGRAQITASSSPHDGWPVLMKRMLDVTLSLVLLVALAPLLVLVGQRGWETENVVDMLERCPALRGAVIEHNSLPDAEMVRLLKGARALLLPFVVDGCAK